MRNNTRSALLGLNTAIQFTLGRGGIFQRGRVRDVGANGKSGTNDNKVLLFSKVEEGFRTIQRKLSLDPLTAKK